jgi:hypothetical protein
MRQLSELLDVCGGQTGQVALVQRRSVNGEGVDESFHIFAVTCKSDIFEFVSELCSDFDGVVIEIKKNNSYINHNTNECETGTIHVFCKFGLRV